MQHDATYKAAFAHPRMVGDLLQLITERLQDPHALLARIRLDTLERLPSEFITDDLRRRAGDMVWRVQLRPPDFRKAAAPIGSGKTEAPAIGPHRDAEPRWLHLLVMLEFQSRADWMMAARIQSYASLLWLDLHRRTPFSRTHPPPPLLPIVLYNGDTPWQAPLRMSDLIGPGLRRTDAAANEATESDSPGIRGSPLQYVGDGFLLVDQRTLGGENLPEHNAQTLMAWIECLDGAALPKGIQEIENRAFEWLPGLEDASLRDVLLGWLGAMAEQLGWNRTGGIDMRFPYATAGRPQGTPEERARQYRLQLLAEGAALGRAEGLDRARVLLRRQATRKFGPETAHLLATRLAEMTDPDRLAEVGEWIIDCEDATVLLERAGSLRIGR